MKFSRYSIAPRAAGPGPFCRASSKAGRVQGVPWFPLAPPLSLRLLEVCARRHGFVRRSPEQEVAEDAVVQQPEAAVADGTLLSPYPASML
jgi:hypothetical protein